MITPGSQMLTLDNPFPGQGTAAARTNVLAFSPDNKASSVVQWSFDIQRALPGQSVPDGRVCRQQNQPPG